METLGPLLQLLELLVSWPVLIVVVIISFLIVVVIISFRKSINDLISEIGTIKIGPAEIKRLKKVTDEFEKLQIILSESVLLQMRAVDAVLSGISSPELLEEHKQKMNACADRLEDHLKEIRSLHTNLDS